MKRISTLRTKDHYRAIPVGVEAIEFDYDHLDEVEEFLGHGVYNLYTERNCLDNRVNHWFKLPTLDGNMRVNEGDIIVRYPTGEIYVRKPNEFKNQFEKVES